MTDLRTDEIQGNIVPGFNKSGHQAFLLLKFSEGRTGRTKVLATPVSLLGLELLDVSRRGDPAS